jgi:prepilin-type N-terminal cleavage/methylation domain-containing protein
MVARRAGFTLVEVLIVITLVLIAGGLLYQPLVNGIAAAKRERTLMNMFRDGDMLMSRLTTYLQPAVLPIPVTAGSVPAASSKYRRYINSMDKGFMRYGRAWRDIMREGADFLPFCVPTKSLLNDSPVDSDGLPILGIIDSVGRPVQSAVYSLGGRTSSEDGERFFSLEAAPAAGMSNNLHPALAGLDPADYGLGGALPAEISPGEPRFAEDLSLAYHGFTDARHKRGFGVVRFVTFLRDGAPVILKEADINFDINHDGVMNDTFVRGSLHVTLVESETEAPHSRFAVPDGSVLLQLNTQDPGYVPLFQLVGGYGEHGNSPSGAQWDGTTPSGGDTYALLIRFLLFDETQDRTIWSTVSNRRQYLTRQFQTSIELRNMSLE